ncbi:Crp/Fnr family transcriptional regulator [Polymorphum gilvum]|uniref:Putative cAMP-dependent kinase protein n=1 Tax=Polymorphum gilvum (strain LMG 25793 / CGMCC 1.9160 / SL003B-26A1) TaxID=991905 RepID=F2IZH1_POLGS|nr:Crp/Fnr family transcriptional regulator [Polymorphum gilvum]ADZ68594.1 Putative cAMP-dependent kinase protein [Polymorphum gilvum SL003B-26A1]
MSLVQDIAILRRIPMLSDFSDDQLRLLAFSAESLDYRDGTVLFDAGERADGGIVVAEGLVSLQKAGPAGFVEIDQAGPGALLGETAMLVETRRPARAVCVGRVRAIRIRRALFKRMIQEFPELAQRLFEAHAARYQATAQALKPIGERLGDLDRFAVMAGLRGRSDG